MISAEEIRGKITLRAKRQFARDMECLKNFVAENGGVISIMEALKLSREADKKELKGQKRFFGFRFGAQKIEEDNYISTFLLKFMAGLELEELKTEDFDSLPLAKIYMESYKKEYEDYQNYLFLTHDAQFYTGAYPIIKGRKFCANVEAEGEVENY